MQPARRARLLCAQRAVQGRGCVARVRAPDLARGFAWIGAVKAGPVVAALKGLGNPVILRGHALGEGVGVVEDWRGAADSGDRWQCADVRAWSGRSRARGSG